MNYYEALSGSSRLLIEVPLAPVQGQRFQPTGFPDLGAANYTLPDGTEKLLVESPQSMANRLEITLWDEVANNLVEPWRGLPFIQVLHKDTRQIITNSILEAHRLNSPYILEGGDTDFTKRLKDELQEAFVSGPDGPIGAINLNQVAKIVFKYDPNCLIHGLFIAKKDMGSGRVRVPRLLSAFIDASDVRPVESGGVKNDRINPSGDTKTGYGNVPFHRTEYVADSITAFFNIDLAQLRGYGLGSDAEGLLLTLSLWKIRKFLEAGLKLRTACDLRPKYDVDNIAATSPEGFDVPIIADLEKNAVVLLKNCMSQFSSPSVTNVVWDPAIAKKSKKAKEGGDESTDETVDKEVGD